MSAKFSSALVGAERLARELKLAVPRTRSAVIGAIKKNTRATAAAARSRAPKVTGEMAGTIRDEYSKDELIGYVRVGIGKLPRRSKAKTAAGKTRAKGRKKTPGQGVYAPVVERGDKRRNRKPHPFLIPAFTAQKDTAVSDISKALNDSVKSI